MALAAPSFGFIRFFGSVGLGPQALFIFIPMDQGTDVQLQRSLLHRRSTIVAIALVAFFSKLALDWCTTGTNDMRIWEADRQVIRAEGGPAVYAEFAPIYEDGKVAHHRVFNHPPMILFALSLWGRLEELTGISLCTGLTATSSLADPGTLALLHLAAWRDVWPIGTPLLCVFAGSPVAIFGSGFHGNPDPLMLVLIVASTFMMESRGVRPAAERSDGDQDSTRDLVRYNPTDSDNLPPDCDVDRQ